MIYTNYIYNYIKLFLIVSTLYLVRIIQMSMIVREQQSLVINRLRKEREKAGLSQLELALRAEISQNMINYIETGKRTPSLDTLLKICNAMNINPSILFSDTEEEKEEAKRQVLDIIQRWM